MQNKLINRKIILFSLFVAVAIAVLVFFYWREAMFSKEILKLEILSSDSAKVGEEIEYTVKYKNNGNFVLENPKLVFELPLHSLTEDGKTRLTKDLKDIYPGGEEFLKFKARLLGKEGDLKAAKASLSYTPHNLSARYESETTFTTKIDSVPITLTYDLPLKVEKGKEFNYSINYFSNVDYPLEDLSIKIDETRGFNIDKAEPLSLDNVEWKLKTLNKSEGGKIKIKGNILSDAPEHLNFSVHLGMWQSGNFIVVKEINQDVQLIQPLLFISQEINGAGNYVASLGETLQYRIFLRNIGSTSFDNLFVLSRLEGDIFDLSTLESSEGQARPNDNLIVFDSKQISDLQRIAPQQEVSVSFKVKLKSQADKNSVVIKNKVNVLDISQEFETKVSSKLELAQKAYHSNFDSIENSGPVPPEVGKTTTYAIHWQIKNYLNDVKNVKVKASLPDNITIGDVLVPEDQASRFSFDSVSREILWLAPDIASSSQISLSFQVALTPSASQQGRTPNLINQAIITAEDQFTGAISQSVAPAVNTTLPDDQANSGGGIVQ